MMTYFYCISNPSVAYFFSKRGGEACREIAHILSFWIVERSSSWRQSPGNIRHRIEMSCGPRLFSSPLRVCPTRKSANAWTCHDRSCRSGVSASSTSAWPACKSGQGAGDPAFFPPEIVVEIKALACQLPKDLGLPFSRLSRDDIAQQAVQRGIVASISGATVWRWLSADAIRPWCYRSWIWPRSPHFEQKAGRVLDLYHRTWNGKILGDSDFVISCDEKTSIQARRRLVATTASTVGRVARVEHEYERKGALAYIAAWDVHRAKLFGLCRPSTGIAGFRDIVDKVMSQEPYRSARRVFWITDNGSSHRGAKAIERLHRWHPNAILIHTPVHASWLNQVEIFFSVLQRKLLTPNDFNDLGELEGKILSFQSLYESTAKPFEWKFTRDDLKDLLTRLSAREQEYEMAA
jgi:hypothetical protein